MPTPSEKYEIAVNLRLQILRKRGDRNLLSAEIKALELDLANVLSDDKQMDLEDAA